MQTHADNLKAGLYPTEEPVARARLCLSCHFGNADRFVTHRLGRRALRIAFERRVHRRRAAHFGRLGLGEAQM
jgi:hypothetical protein